MQVSEVLRGAGTVGLGALDTFSSSVANLNNRGGFAAAAIAKGNKIGILAFEVANTIVKGCNLKMTLGEEDIKTLKEEVLDSEGVQRLVSNNHEELLLIAAADKRWGQSVKKFIIFLAHTLFEASSKAFLQLLCVFE